MKFMCNFCTEHFSDFLTYKRHLNSQHYEEKRVKITKINLEKERISCVNSCNWLEDSKEHILFNIDGIKFCADCKEDRIDHWRIEKAFQGLTHFSKMGTEKGSFPSRDNRLLK